MATPRDLSVVIPTLNEAANLPGILSDLAPLVTRGADLIVADGGSTDGTIDLAIAAGVRVVSAHPGRGRQLRTGIAASTRALLFVVHADARLPAASIAWLGGDALAATAPHALRLRIAGDGWRYRLIERGALVRSRLFALPYGDQGLVIRRETLDTVGGFQDVPLMEDVVLARALRRVVPIAIAPFDIVVSSRRWERDGPLSRSTRNLWLLARLFMGADLHVLARHYQPERTPVRHAKRPVDSPPSDG